MTSIRRHLVLGLIGGTSVLLGLAGVALYLHARSFLAAEFDAALRAKAMALVTLIDWDRGKVELNFADAFMPEYSRRERPDYFQVWLDSGSTLERSRSLGTNDLPRRAGTLAAPGFWDLPLPNGQPGRAVGMRFTAKRDLEADAKSPETASLPQPSVALVVARERSGLDQSLATLRIALALVVTLLLAAMAGLVALVVRRGLKPLALVGERAAAIDASSLQERFPIDAMPAELQPISQRLNDLLGRLEAAFLRERRISADIAHELRTPLAELRTLAEVAIKWPGDATNSGAAFRDVLAIARKMETMVSGLLLLARSEEGKLSLQCEPVAVADLVEEVWSPLAHQAQRKQLALALDIPRDWCLRTDPALLRHVIANLLSNAVEYTPTGGHVEVRGIAVDGEFRFSVENTTDNLSAADLPHLFERFWRKDPARTNSGHGGLGLTLAQSVATVLGLRLDAQMPGPDRLRVTLRGPHKSSP